MIELADTAERTRRRDICRACPFVQLLGRKQFMRCTKCHCPLSTKTMFLRATCPEGKWYHPNGEQDHEAPQPQQAAAGRPPRAAR